MLKTKLLLLAMALSISSCVIAGQENKKDDKTYCLYFEPVYLAEPDVISPPAKRSILRNNESGASLCGWKPVSGE